MQVIAASQWLCPADRDQFWSAIVTDLKDCAGTDAEVTRAIAKAFRVFYRPLSL
jgi:hypothetical protein